MEKTGRDIKVNIPAGISEGSHLRLKGEGNSGAYGGPKGDLYVVVHEEEHPFFTRHGNDLLCEVPVTFTQAALGTEVEVPTIKGKAKLKVPAGTQSHTVFRLRGEGIPHLRGSRRGDQHVRVIVEVPRKLNKKQREAMKALDEVEDKTGNGIWDKIKDTFK